MVTAAGKFIFGRPNVSIEFIKTMSHGQNITFSNFTDIQAGDLFITMYSGVGVLTAIVGNSGQTQLAYQLTVNGSNSVHNVIWYHIVRPSDITNGLISWNRPHSTDDWYTHQYRGNWANITTVGYQLPQTTSTFKNNAAPCDGLTIRCMSALNRTGTTTSGSILDEGPFGGETGVLVHRSGIDYDGDGNLRIDQDIPFQAASATLTFS